jgi:methyl acetate hydrolase
MDAAERVREALSEGIERAGLAGVAAAARTPSGEVVAAAAGVRGADNPAPMTPDTQFWIASCTKAVTAMAALLAVEDGLIGLDDPVARWLPELASPQRLTGFDAGGKPQLEPTRTPITLRRLLTHTSGLAYAFTSPLIDRFTQTTGLNSVADAGKFPLVFEPGEGWIYGTGIDWTGQLIAAAAGEPFESLLRRRVLTPLGMDDTGFFPSAEQKQRLASMHARLPDGGVTPIPFGMPEEPHFMMGGGGLYSTVKDYLKFLESVLGVGPQVLKPASLEALCARELDGPGVGVLRSGQPNTSNDFDPFPGARTGWTLGFVTNLEPGPNGRSAGSLAWGGLGNCYYWIDRDAGAAGVFCAQLLPFADPRTLAAFAAFERAVYAA